MTVDLLLGDCLEVMTTLSENSVDSIITDPPYGLKFMGKDWDKGVPGVAFWQEALRVAKPGAILLAMGGTRTFHRLVVAIEDAGWEIRDTIAWIYGQGFPKSHNISKAIDKTEGSYVAGEETGNSRHGIKGDKNGYNHSKVARAVNPQSDFAQLWDGWGTALKPAMELICIAMKPIDGTFAENALKWGVAGLNIDGGRVEGILEGDPNRFATTDGGWGVKEFHTPPVVRNSGRFPANIILDGSDEVVGLFPDSKTNHIEKPVVCDEEANTWGGTFQRNRGARGYDGNGSAARFFYCAKASRSERNAGLEGMEEKGVQEYGSIRANRGNGYPDATLMQNHHPTVKPLALMRYLCRLTKTPTGGVVLDPFVGSGTTGCAAVLERRNFIGIDNNAEYLEIAKRRIEYTQEQKRLLDLAV